MGYIPKALEKGYFWNTPGLHAVLTICFRFLSIWDGACVASCLFLLTGRHPVRIQIHATYCCRPRCTTETHAFLKWPFLTDFKSFTHTPPYGTNFWCIRQKIEKTLKQCEFAPRWHITSVPERYIYNNNKSTSHELSSPSSPSSPSTQWAGTQPPYPRLEDSLLNRQTGRYTRKYQPAYSCSLYGTPPSPATNSPNRPANPPPTKFSDLRGPHSVSRAVQWQSM